MQVKDYMSFISSCKTERECTHYFRNILSANGFENLDNLQTVSAKDKVYMCKMDKALAAFKIGNKPIQEGMNILCAHIDSPRIDIKLNPVYSDNGLIYMDTHYYGGIRNYQWLTRPLAMHGIICKKDGSSVKVNIGENNVDPVFYIADLLPHMAYEQEKESADKFIPGESLDILIGNNIDEGKDIKDFKPENDILNYLKTHYDIEENDFQSAELEIVPAGSARFVGFDNNLIMGYGHDDRSCAYASFEAFMDEVNSDRTTCVLLVDKEEIGSVGATGLDSKLFENMVSELVYKLDLPKEFDTRREYIIRKCLENSNILSSDVNAAYDPQHADLFDANNASYLGKGPCFCKFTGYGGKYDANDANPEYIAKLRNMLDTRKIPYQVSEMGKVDKGGGGTIALYAASYGMNTIDVGIPVLSMHAPCEIIDKRDLLNAYAVYRGFLKDL